MAERTPLFMDINEEYSGDELALPYRDLISEGVVGAGALAVSETGTPGLSVDVAAGAAWVLGDTDTDFQPCYRVFNDAVVNKGISPDASLPRKVLVVAQISDETFTGSGREWNIVAIHGTPDASPALPATPDSALPLASIDVDAGATSIVDADITDMREQAAIGGNIAAGSNSYVLIRDQKASGTDGGASVASAWTARVLNTEASDDDGVASLAANRVTLAAGTYECRISAPFFSTPGARVKVRLRNVTDGATVLVGTNGYAVDAGCECFIAGRFTIAAGKELEVQYYKTVAQASTGLGVNGATGADGEVEVYTVAEFRKVA